MKGSWVFELTQVLVIAEAGVNHNGDLATAIKLIEAAADSGADLVKFQSFNAAKIATKTAKKASYQEDSSSLEESQYEMLSALELTRDHHFVLMEHCKRVGIGFFSTAFDLESLEFLHSLGFELFKIPSGEITNYPYLRAVAGYSGKVLLSTGMSTEAEVKKAIEVLEEFGTSRNNLTVLQCTSAYPAPKDQVNLLAMKTMGRNFEVSFGYSDHTIGTEVAIAAVALGATVIEKHLTLSRDLPGPDHKASLEPHEFALMVKAIRNIETALGSRDKFVTPAESENISIVRKSIVASQTIRKGEILTESNITTKRPGNGLSPMLWNEIIGQEAQYDYHVDEYIRG
jgi:N,N'-diacetyllegionaminate synthase